MQAWRKTGKQVSVSMHEGKRGKMRIIPSVHLASDNTISILASDISPVSYSKIWWNLKYIILWDINCLYLIPKLYIYSNMLSLSIWEASEVEMVSTSTVTLAQYDARKVYIQVLQI